MYYAEPPLPMFRTYAGIPYAAPCSEYEALFPDVTKYNDCIAAERMKSVVGNLAGFTNPTQEQVQTVIDTWFPPETPMAAAAPAATDTIAAVNVYQESIGTPFRSVLQTPQAGQGTGFLLVVGGALAAAAVVAYWYMMKKSEPKRAKYARSIERQADLHSGTGYIPEE